MKYCPNCGRELADEMKFCGGCGAEQQEVGKRTEFTNQEDGEWNILCV